MERNNCVNGTEILCTIYWVIFAVKNILLSFHPRKIMFYVLAILLFLILTYMVYEKLKSSNFFCIMQIP